MYIRKIKEGLIKGMGGLYINVQNHPRVFLFHINF